METLETVIKNIKDVKVQGAKEIALYALKFLKDFCKKNGFGLKFEVACKFLEEARPTAVVLHNCLEILKSKRNLKTIDKLINYLENVNKKIAKFGNKIVKDNYLIMTHCHSGEALSVIKHAWKSKKKISVIATETEPLHQGIKTVKELAKEKIPVTLIVDSAMGYFMKSVDMVIVGTDAIRIVEPKGVVNKIGTLLLALAAKKYNKPFYVVGNLLKIDKRKFFKIEERPYKEVYHKLKGVKIRNPAFDVVPFNLVTGIVNEKGVFKTNEFLKKFANSHLEEILM
jgi:ribose 1,5-bisphosphate isomerase